MNYTYIFVFVGNNSEMPSGIFTEYTKAESWITQNSLSGSLNKLPLDISLYDWAISEGYFEPKNDYQREAKFIQRFTSASVEHWHFESGNLK